MTNTQITVTFLEKQILGLAGEFTYLTVSNKISSHLCTTIFNDRKFTTSQGRSFYFQSDVIKSFLLVKKILFLHNFHPCCPLNFQRNFPSLLHMTGFIFRRYLLLPGFLSLKAKYFMF